MFTLGLRQKITMADRSDVLKCALSLRPDQLVMLRFATEVAGIKKPSPEAYASKDRPGDQSYEHLDVAERAIQDL